MATRILIVEDEEAIRGFIKVNLKRNNIALCQELEEHLKTNKKEVI